MADKEIWADGDEFTDFSESQMEIGYLFGLIISDYLIKVHRKEFHHPDLKVRKINTISGKSVPISRPPTINYNTRSDHYFIVGEVAVFSVLFKECDYDITMVLFHDSYHEHKINLLINVAGMMRRSKESDDLLEFVRLQSIRNSSFRNKTLILEGEIDMLNGQNESYVVPRLKVAEVKKTKLDEIYLSQRQKNHLHRFIYAVRNYEKDKIHLRYLLNGPPGTGKSQLINAIVSELDGEITTVFCERLNNSFWYLVHFSSYFEKSLIIIDDIDLVLADRKDFFNNVWLSSFLSAMDGIFSKDVFLLASTNDKKFVDLAASRPGRFDLVLDVTAISRENYLQLVNRETTDTELIELFNEEVLNLLERKKVTGALIVSLIKQLKSLKLMKGSISREDFDNYFDMIYKGHYETNAGNGKEVGFNNGK